MASFRTELEQALDQVIAHRRYFDFQKFAFHLARQKWPSLQATELVHDLGSDGVVFVNGEAKLALACSVEGDLPKLRKDCRRLKDARQTVSNILFATTRTVTEQTAEGWRKKIREEFGLYLEQVLGREWLITEAEDIRMRWLCRDYLGMAVIDVDASADEIRRTRAAAQKITAIWCGKYAGHGLPIVDLTLESISPNGTQQRRLSDLEKDIEAGCRLWIEGAPGGGKTHSIVTLADSILAREDQRLIAILVSLRALSQTGGSLLSYVATQPAFQEQGINEAKLAQLAAGGRVVFLFNGWNEISAARWSVTVGTITDLIEQIPAAGAVIVSRPIGFAEVAISCRQFRLRPLSLNDIRDVLSAAGIRSWRSAWAKLREEPRLLELASVPLFLHELVRELGLDSELPLTRLGILNRMVSRAENEHREALRESCLRDNSQRYLCTLAWDMTIAGRVDLSFGDAAASVSRTAQALQAESLIAQRPAPPDVLRELFRCHLLEEDSNVVVFVHQLVQEYFAALELSTRLRANDPALRISSAPIFGSYHWEQTLALATENLVAHGSTATAGQMVKNLAVIDLEAACRLVGIAPQIWSTVSDQLEGDIQQLAHSGESSAVWIATRCGAWTGQAVFSRMVASALLDEAMPYRACLHHVPTVFVLSAIGAGFAEHLLATTTPERRVDVLQYLSQDYSSELSKLFAALAMKDESPEVRRLALFHLFKNERPGFLKILLRDARSMGWNFQMLRLLRASPHGNSRRIGRIAQALLPKENDPEERTRIIRQWFELGGDGWEEVAKKEYGRLTTSPDQKSEKLIQCRFVILDSLSKLDPKWCSRRFAEEINQTQDMQRMRMLRPSAVSEPEDRHWLIDQQIAKLQTGSSNDRCPEEILNLAPQYAARSLLASLLKTPDSEGKWRLRGALHQIDRPTVIRETLLMKFEETDSVITLLHALSPGYAGGEAVSDALAPSELNQYRHLLLQWAEMMPEMNNESAESWALFSTLLGELQFPEDAGRIHSLLLRETERLHQAYEKNRRSIQDYVASARRGPAPVASGRVTWQSWHMSALRRIPGRACDTILQELLNDPSLIGSAAHELATRAGGASVDVTGSMQSRPRFDLIWKRRSEAKVIGQSARELLDAIKHAIDRHLADRKARKEDSVYCSLFAIARLTDGSDISWILDKLERDLTENTPDELLEVLVLRGFILPGQRIQPLVQRRFTAANKNWKGPDEQSWLVLKGLIALFFSDDPQSGIQALQSDVKWFRHNDLYLLARCVCWSQDARCIGWLRNLCLSADGNNDRRDALLNLAVVQSRALNDQRWLLTLPHEYCAAGQGSLLIQGHQFRNGVEEWARETPHLQKQLNERARAATNTCEAAVWYALLSQFEAEDEILTILELAEKFHADLRILDSIYPYDESKGGMSFAGRFGGHGSLCSPVCMKRLRELARSKEVSIRQSATRGLFWLERERLGYGPYEAGERWPTNESPDWLGNNYWLTKLLTDVNPLPIEDRNS